MLLKKSPDENSSLVTGPPSEHETVDASIFLSNRYSGGVFRGILIDTGAAHKSTVGKAQFEALSKTTNIKLDTSRAGEAKIRFGIGEANSIGSIDINTPIGVITFHVLDTDTPFLLCIQDMDKAKAYFNNLTNEIEQGKKRIPIIRAYGHPWMFLDTVKAVTYCNDPVTEIDTLWSFLTESQLRTVHRRLGHPNAARLWAILNRAGHLQNHNEIERLTRYCKYCQKHSRKPMRFKFTVKDDLEFNHTVFVDMFFIEGEGILHLVDKATGFQAARFSKKEDAQSLWDICKEMWIDTYLGPPDWFISDAGKNVSSKVWKDNAKVYGSRTKAVPTEAHNAIGLVERYHIPLKRAYNIIREECPTLTKAQCL